MDALQKYIKAFSKLKQGVTKYGLAPHKPVMLLSVLQGFESSLINENKIYITPELVFLFKSNWNSLIKTNHVCNFALPFFHLKGEKFWKIIPKQGFESIIFVKESISSFAEINAIVDYVILNDDLYNLVKKSSDNLILQQFILNNYFPETGNDLKETSEDNSHYFNDIENKILNESPTQYQAEIKELLQEKNEEEIFIRGSLFKREIPKIYNNTCCISGMKIDATITISMIDACHIVPFSESYNDTITNGIALCPNLHRAFDRGLIGIDENYKVIVSNYFKENESIYSIRKFEGKEIYLPNRKDYYPFQENFEWHRKNKFK